jgi:type IV pilus assembly protein PilA
MQDILARIRAKKADEGFTLIELLVVVVIIGVLVAIAIPIYLNYREGAADKSAQSDVRGGISAVENFYSSNNNTYPDTNVTAAAGANVALATAVPVSTSNGTITVSDNTTLHYVRVTASTYKICAINSGGSGKYYLYTSSTGGSVRASSAITSANFDTCGP